VTVNRLTFYRLSTYLSKNQTFLLPEPSKNRLPHNGKKWHFVLCTVMRKALVAKPGANPTAAEFTTTTPASIVCSRLERIFKVEENNLNFKTHKDTRGVENFYSAGVVTHDRRIFLKEVARGGEQTRVLSISFIFSFSPLYR
jgi:hypothetical protein